jgi:hypothetical protein
MTDLPEQVPAEADVIADSEVNAPLHITCVLDFTQADQGLVAFPSDLEPIVAEELVVPVTTELVGPEPTREPPPFTAPAVPAATETAFVRDGVAADERKLLARAQRRRAKR